MTGIEQLGGIALIAVICGLLFIEELGVPIPFAPGDVVLLIGGIAVAAGRVDPVWFVSLTFLVIVAGAMLGRELTALLGWERLMKLARPLRAEKALERVAELLRRGGWRTVFTARLIPGLRVHTTQMAGVTGVARSSYFAGLVPSAVVYVLGFVGLGAAFGRPVIALVEAGTHQVVLGVVAVVLLVVLALVLRAWLRRTLASLESGGWTGPFRMRLDALDLAVLPICIGINITGHAIAVGLKLPFFLDSAGTILAGIVAGPWAGGTLGVLSNLLSSNTFDPIAASYAIVSFAVGFGAGLSRYLRWQRRAGGWILLWAVVTAISALLSTPINFLVSGGQSGVPFGDAVYASMTSHLPRVLAAFLGELAVDLPDKLIAVLIALWIAQALARQPAVSGGVDLDLREAFTYAFHSPRWKRRMLAGVLCLAFAWLVIPGLLLLGYLLDLSRSVRDGHGAMPAWDRRWRKIKDGFAIAVLFVIWSIPGIVVSLVGGILTDPDVAPAVGPAWSRLGDVLSGAGNVWQFLVLVIQMPVWAQYARGGFGAALSLRAISRRLRFNPSLTVVVAGLTVILLFVGVVGLVGLAVGILVSLVYTSLVWAHIAGTYARFTDPMTWGGEATGTLAGST